MAITKRRTVAPRPLLIETTVDTAFNLLRTDLTTILWKFRHALLLVLTLTTHSISIITSFTLTIVATWSIGAHSAGVASMVFRTLVNIWINVTVAKTESLKFCSVYICSQVFPIHTSKKKAIVLCRSIVHFGY